MKKVILWKGREVDLEAAKVHVAPGGSCLFDFEARGDRARELGDFLWRMREEFAFGLSNASVDGEVFHVGIYLGLADVPEFEAGCASFFSDSGCVKTVIDEGESRDGYSIRSRDAVLKLLRS